jgi:hypothetical protein
MGKVRPLQKVGQAGAAVEQAAIQANLLMREFRNGFTVYVQRAPGNENTIMDFVMGRCDELPIALKIEPKER